MMSETPASAFHPLATGPLAPCNRVIEAAMNEDMSKKGLVSKALARFHERMAKGGAAMPMVAYCATSRDGRTLVDQVMLDSDSVADFRALTDGVARSNRITDGVEVSRILERAGAYGGAVERPERRVDHRDVRFVLSQGSRGAGRGPQPDQSGSLNR